jgi:protein involved in polysaccharide export with SLBB domain
MMGRVWGIVAILAVGLQLAGCYTDFGPVAASPDPIVHPSAVAGKLQTGDTVRVVIYGEESLTGSYVISPSGEITMPLIGRVPAAGLSKNALAHEISSRYAGGKFLQDPKVTVDVASYRPIYIFGETLRPGAYPYSAGLNVLTALTLAGGPTFRGSKDRVFIQHPGETVWNEYPLDATVIIEPGDLIRVPERYF